MKKMLFVLFVTLISFMSFSQNQELIVGNWMYQDLYEKEKVDEKRKKKKEECSCNCCCGNNPSTKSTITKRDYGLTENAKVLME
jgi:hypothetical protein